MRRQANVPVRAVIVALVSTTLPGFAAAQHHASERVIGFADADKLLTIAQQILAGEIAAAAKEFEKALYHLDRAVRLEDSLLYNEPPDWYYPVRHTLGAVLLEAGLPVEAEVVYSQDLGKNRNNGFALFGLARSLRAQGRDEEAAEIERRFENAWEAADVKLSSSRF